MTDPLEALRAFVAQTVRDELAKLAKQPANDELLTTSEAAEFAKVTAATVRRWVRGKKLKRHGPGLQVRIRRDELERFLLTGAPASDSQLTPAERARKRFG